MGIRVTLGAAAPFRFDKPRHVQNSPAKGESRLVHRFPKQQSLKRAGAGDAGKRWIQVHADPLAFGMFGDQ
jgi:hypothetical protein